MRSISVRFYVEAIVKDARTEALIKSAEAILNDEPEPSETPISQANLTPALSVSPTVSAESFITVDDTDTDFVLDEDVSPSCWMHLQSNRPNVPVLVAITPPTIIAEPIEETEALNWDVIEVAPATTPMAIAVQPADNDISFALLDDLELTPMDEAVSTPAPIASPELNFAGLELVDVDFAPVVLSADVEPMVMEQAKVDTSVTQAPPADSSYLFDLTDDDSVEFAAETETVLSQHEPALDELALPDFLTEETLGNFCTSRANSKPCLC